MTKTYFESWKQKANQTKLIVYGKYNCIDLTQLAWPVVDSPKRYEILDFNFGDDDVTIYYIETRFGYNKYISENCKITLQRTEIKRVAFY